MMEEYWNYLSKHLTSYKKGSRVLVVGAEDDTLVLKIHDLGLFESITCTDRNREVINAMLRKHMLRTEIKWRSLHLDPLQKLVPRILSNLPFDVVIDNGTLHALSSIDRSEILHYILQTELVLTFKGGGKFICFIDCRTSTAQMLVTTLLKSFRSRYKFSYQRLVESHVMIVIEKMVNKIPYLIGYEIENVQTDFLDEIIHKENSERMKLLDNFNLSLDHITSGVMGDPNLISQGRYFQFKYNVFGLEYNILVLDVNQSPHCSYSWWRVFYATQVKDSTFRGIEDMEKIASHADGCARIYVVLLDCIQEYLNTDNLEKDLSPMFESLAPKSTTKSPRKFTKIPKDKLFAKKECEELEELGESLGKDEGTKEVRVCGGISEGENESDSVCEDEGTKMVGKCGDIGEGDKGGESECRSGEGAAESSKERKTMVEEKYEYTLTEWLDSHKEEIWDDVYEQWQDLEFLQSANLDEVRGWNSSRPTDKCCQIISGIIKALCDYQSKKKIHRGLSNMDNYLISFRKSYRDGLSYEEAHVTFGDLDGVYDSFGDVIDVEDVIFTNILGDRKIPKIWNDLKSMLSESSLNIEALKGHPACWNWYRRYQYFGNLWMRIIDQDVAGGNDLTEGVYTVLDVVRMLDCDGWVPHNTPLGRCFKENSYANDWFDYVRFMRNLAIHIHERDRHKDNEFCYIKKGDDKAFLKTKFIEVCMTECFPDLLIKLFKILVEKEVEV